MDVLISLIIKETLQSQSAYFKYITSYLIALACIQIFMGKLKHLLCLLKKGKYKMLFI